MKFATRPDGTYGIDYEDGRGFVTVSASEYGREHEQRQMMADMSRGERFLVGAGKTFTDWGRGAQNLYARATDDMAGLDAAQAAQAEAQAEYQPMRDYGGLSARAGEMAPAAATGLLGGTGFWGGLTQLGIGGGLGALENPDEALTGAGVGLGVTAGGIAAGSMLNRVVTSIGRAGSTARNTVMRDTLQKGERAGLEFTPGQLSQERPALLMEERLRRTPGYAGIDAERIAANQRRLNELSADTLGLQGEAISPTMLGKTADDVGKVFDDIANQSEDIILDTAQLSELTENLSEPAEALMNRMRSKHPGVFDTADTSGAVSGTDFNNGRNWLAKQLRKDANVQSGAADELSEMMGILDDGLEAANPQLAEEIAAARKKWKAFLVVQDSLRGAKASATGDISAPGAYQALRKYDKRGFERGGVEGDDFYDAVRAMAATQDVSPLTGVNPGTFGGGWIENLVRRPVAENYMRGNRGAALLMGLMDEPNKAMTPAYRRAGIGAARGLMANDEQ